MSKRNGKDYAKWIIAILAVVGLLAGAAGVIWNAAILHNDVVHLESRQGKMETNVEEMRLAITRIETKLSERKK